MATTRKSDKEYPGYLQDQDRALFVPSAREEELLCRTVHPEEFEGYMKLVAKNNEGIKNRIETLEVRFNALCNMLNVQLANSGFLTLKIEEGG